MSLESTTKVRMKWQYKLKIFFKRVCSILLVDAAELRQIILMQLPKKRQIINQELKKIIIMAKLYKEIDKGILKAIPNPSKEAYEIKVKIPEFTFFGR